jgi:hypothetical protein
MTNTNMTVAQRIVKNLQSAKQEVTKWNDNEYRKANDMLYSFLKVCYEEYRKLMNASIDIRKEFDEELKLSTNIAFTKGTQIEVKVVRAVFQIDAASDKRAFKYARVLKIAKDDNVKVDGFVNWLQAQNGIDNVSSESTKQKADAAKAKKEAKIVEAYKAASNGVAALSLKDIQRGSHNYNELSIALVRHTKDSVECVTYSNNVSVLEAILNEKAEYLNANAKAQQNNASAQKNRQTKEQVRKEVAATTTV